MANRHDQLPPQGFNPDEIGPEGTFSYPPAQPDRLLDEHRGTGALGGPRTGNDFESLTPPPAQPDSVREALERRTNEKPSHTKRNLLVMGGAALTGIAAGAALLFGQKSPDVGAQNTPPPSEPGISANQVPGAGETTSKTPEAVTAETAEFRLNGKTLVGVEALYIELMVPQEIPANRPKPTVEGDTATWNEYLNSLQEATNVEASEEARPFLKETIEKVLFSNADASALAGFIEDLQAKGSKIVSIEDSLVYKPLDVEFIHGKATLIYTDANGTPKKKYMKAALGNSSGIAKQWDKVSIVSDEPVVG